MKTIVAILFIIYLLWLLSITLEDLGKTESDDFIK